MAAVSDTDDTSEIFWPGYVDAVTNLAINLLFVIAVMSIVVMTAILQISKMKPQPEASQPPQAPLVQQADDKQFVSQTSSTSALTHNTALNASLQQLQQALDQAQTSLQPRKPDSRTSERADTAQDSTDTAQQLRQLRKQMAQLQKQLQNAPTASAATASVKATREGGTSTDVNQAAEVVQAQQRTPAAPAGQNQVQDLSAGGVVVVFGSDVIELSEGEVAELLRKLAAKGPLQGNRWQLRVISPKGFSEATRMAYYRVNSLRNVLLKHGAQAQDIEMRVIETENDAASNARVLVRLMP